MNNDDNKLPQFSSELMRQGPAIRKAYMTSLVRLIKDCGEVGEINVLEVGSWAGASTITWATAIQKAGIGGSVHCVDIWKPYFDLNVNQAPLYRAMDTAARTGDILEQFKRNIHEAGVQNIVTYTIGDSKNVLPRLEAGRFQIVFIDASHKYEDVLFDVQEAQRLVADGGIVCGDDLELLVSSVDQAAHELALQLGLDFVLDPKTQVSYHPGVSQAISEVFQDVSVGDGFWAIRRRGNSWETIDLAAMELIIPEHLVQFDAPTVVCSEFGFNIVNFRNVYVAVRQSLGPVEFFDTPLEKLQELYLQDDFAIEQSLVDARLRVHFLEISRLSAVLAQYQENTFDSGVPQAGQPEGTYPFNEYKGYNLVAWQGRYLAVRQAIWPIDLSSSVATLKADHQISDVLVASDIDDLLTHVDVVSQSIYMAEEVAKLKAELSHRLSVLEGGVGVRLKRFMIKLIRWQ